ncbi:MAG: immune inhibitor A [Anaerolineales bacterium]|nr:immune inhibitor A [Anaerolineales bacterium]
MIENEPKKSGTSAIVIGIVVLLCCICTIVAGLGGYMFYASGQVSPTVDIPPIFTSDDPTPTVETEVTRPPVDSISTDTLSTLQNAIVPENDPYELACELQNICDVSKTVEGKTYKIGDKEQFWISNSDTAEHSQITATLMYETPHSYFWVEEGTSVNEADMKALMDTFENKIYPTDREFFGSESNPGVDGDPHIYVLYASSIGHNIAGYFNSSDSFNPLVKEFSNGHETYVLGTSQALSDEYTYGVLAHEFVHMIQFPTDRNDVSWIGEGFAEVGSFLNGYYSGGADYIYMQNPDMQLNTWEDNSSPDFSAHYGVSFLYLTYFLDRFGKDATKALTSNPENDLTSVDDTLADLNITDPLTGELITADDVYMDWAVANLLQDETVGDGRFTYHNYPDAPQASPTETISTCPQSPLTRDVHQYGVDYIAIKCAGDYTLSFTGSTVTGLLPASPYSGEYAFWSNKGDESDMTLTKEFDFTGVSGPVELSFRTWYDIEEDWDYVYVEASEDGETWQIITTPSGTDTDPSGNSYGWGYTGATSDWIEEKVDLSAYAGKKISVRFQYITDAAINGEGFMVDDISVAAAGYSSDLEADEGGWAAEGFVRVQNVLPQTFGLTLIKTSDSSVTRITLNADQTAEIPFSLESGETAYLVVAGLTRFTRELGAYQIEIK